MGASVTLELAPATTTGLRQRGARDTPPASASATLSPAAAARLQEEFRDTQLAGGYPDAQAPRLNLQLSGATNVHLVHFWGMSS